MLREEVKFLHTINSTVNVLSFCCPHSHRTVYSFFSHSFCALDTISQLQDCDHNSVTFEQTPSFSNRILSVSCKPI